MKFEHFWMNKWLPFYLIHSIFFNFRYLPIKQAIKLPILLYHPKFLRLKGRISIIGTVRPAMIQLGLFRVPLYNNNGCLFQIDGTVIFKGNAKIGNDSKIIIGKNSTVIFGNNFNATASLKIVSYNKIEFGEHCLIGWDNMFMDYDFHKLKSLNGSTNKGFGTIEIGHDTWFGNGCRTYKNTLIPPNTVVAANTVVTKYSSSKEYTIIGNNHSISIMKEGVYHDFQDDKIGL